MKKLQWAAGLLLSFSVIAILLISSFEIVMYADFSVYQKEYEKYDVLDELDMDMEDVMYVTEEMMAYLRGDRDTLSVVTTVEGKEQDFFNKQDRFHMGEVRDLFIGGLNIRTGAVIVSLICLVFLIASKARLKKILARSYQIALGITGAAVLFIGAAAIMGVTTALMRIIFPPEHIGRGMSINAMVVAVSIAAGPSIAGLILSFASWHWLFAINLPLGVCAITAGYLLLPENPSRQTPIRRKFDKLGGICSALTFGLLIYSLEGIAHDENRWLVLIQLLLLLAIGTFFIRRERHEETPILPLDLLRIPIFALSVIASIASFTAQMLAMIALPFFLQNIAGRSEVETGLLMTPWPVATVLTAPIAGRLVERFHPGILGGIGMALYSLGLLLLVFLPSEPTNGELAWRLAICGIGFGLFQTPNNSTMMSAAPAYRSGGANGMQGTARLLGQTTGTTLVALIFRLIHGTNPLPTCLTLAIGFAVVAGITSVCRLSQPTPIRKRH